MVERNIANLKESLRSSLNQRDDNSSRKILKRIHSFCLNLYNTSKLSIIYQELFYNEPKLLDICSISDDNVPKCIIEEVLDFITNLTRNDEDSLESIAVLIKKYTIGLLSVKSSSSKIKELALKCLQQIILATKNYENKIDFEEEELVKQLFVMSQSKPGVTVQSKLFELLGNLATIYPSVFESYKNMFENVCIQTLSSQVTNTSKAPTISTIAGCLEGLASYYVAFPPREDRTKFLQVYDLNMRILQMTSGARLQAFKSSFRFFSEHWLDLDQEIFRDIETIYTTIYKLCRHSNYQYKLVAKECMASLLKTVNSVLIQKLSTPNGELSKLQISVFNYLVRQFTQNIREVNNCSTDLTLLEIDIKCFGFMAKSCAKLLPKSTLESICSLIINHVWREYNFEREQEIGRIDRPSLRADRLVEIVTSISALFGAQLAKQVEEYGERDVNEDETTGNVVECKSKVDAISRLTMIMIEFYPRLDYGRLPLFRRLFTSIINNLKVDPGVMDSVLQDIVYPALILSCSFPIPPDYNIVQDFAFDIEGALTSGNNNPDASEELIEEETVDMMKTFSNTSIKDYLTLWSLLLAPKKDDLENVSGILFDNTMTCFLKVLDRIDLSYKSQDEVQKSNDNNQDVNMAENVDDISNVQIHHTDPLVDKAANTPKDFVIFVNLCEFYKFLMKQKHEDKMKRWAPICLRKFVTESLRYPLISGFYRLICSTMVILDRINYFSEIVSIEPSTSMETDVPDNLAEPDNYSVTKDIQLLTNKLILTMSNYNDELLLACLEFLVNLPNAILIATDASVSHNDDNLSEYSLLSFLKLAIKIGTCYLPLSRDSIRMVKRWSKDASRMEPYLTEILPCFRPMLLSTSKSSSAYDNDDLVREIEGNDVNHRKKLQKLVNARRDKRGVFKTLRYLQEAQRRMELDEDDEGDATGDDRNDAGTSGKSGVVKMLVRVLGDLGMQYSKLLVIGSDVSNSITNQNSNWTNEPVTLLPYEIPFIDLKPELSLEQLLPLVTELATSAKDAQTRSLAAEVLHTIMTIMIGRTAFQPSTGIELSSGGNDGDHDSRHNMVGVWKKLLPISLVLATDINKISKTLFSDLLHQLAFWYSYPANSSLPETKCFIDSLFKAVVNCSQENENSNQTEDVINESTSTNAQRDFAGKLLSYILESSYEHRKQQMNFTTQNMLLVQQQQLYNLRLILDRIYTLATHFSGHKRMGAIFVLNSIFPILKKDAEYLKKEIFVLYYYVIICQKLSENDKNIGIFTQLSSALEQVHRIIFRYRVELIEVNNDRNKPPHWAKSTVEFAIRWVLSFWACPDKYFRRICIKSAERMARCFDESQPAEFFKALIHAKDHSYFVQKLEHPSLKDWPMTKTSSITTVDDMLPSELLLDRLCASTVCYKRLVQIKVIEPINFFSTASSKYFTTLTVFLNQLGQLPPSRALTRLSSSILDFLPVLIGSLQSPSQMCSLLDIQALINFLAKLFLTPYTILSNFCDDGKRTERFSKKIYAILDVIPDDMCDELIRQMKFHLSKYQFKLACTSSGSILDLDQRKMSFTEMEYLFGLLRIFAVKYSDSNYLNADVQNELFQMIVNLKEDREMNTNRVILVFDQILRYLLQLPDEKYLTQLIKMLQYRQLTRLMRTHRLVVLKSLIIHPSTLLSQITTSNWPILLPLVAETADLLASLTNGNKTKSAVGNTEDSDMSSVPGQFSLSEDWSLCNSNLVSTVNEYWNSIWLEDQQSCSNIDKVHITLIWDVLQKTIMVDSRVCGHKGVARFFRTILLSEVLSLEMKTEILCLFPHLLRHSSTETDIDQIIDSVQQMMITHLPVTSKELHGRSASMALNYSTIYKTVIHSLNSTNDIETACKILKNLLIPAFCRETDHPQQDLFLSVYQTYCLKLSSENLQELLLFLESELRQITDYNHTMQFIAVFFQPAILTTNPSLLKEFFVTRIVGDWKNSIDPAILNNNNQGVDANGNAEKQLRKMQTDLRLVILVYRTVGPIYPNQTREKMGLRDSALVSDLSKRCRSVIDSSVAQFQTGSSSQYWEQLIIETRGLAFNCLVAVVIATQTDEKFYIHLLLKPNKPLFQKIILNNCFNQFPGDIPILKKRKIYYRDIAQNVPTQSQQLLYQPTVSKNPLSSYSQFLSDSSLAFDVRKMDQTLYEMTSSENTTITQSEYEHNIDSTHLSTLELRDNEVNQHICMDSFVLLLNRMKKLELITIVKKEAIVFGTEAPLWMKLILDTFMEHGCSLDIKYFIVMLIINCKDIFQSYSKFWLPGLISLITSTSTLTFNQFTITLLEMIADWSLTAEPQNQSNEFVPRSLKTALVEWLMSKINSDNPGVVKVAMELFGKILNCWWDSVDVPFQLIFDNMVSDKSTLRGGIGVQMLAVVMKNGFKFMPNQDIEKKKIFVSRLCQNLNHPHKSVFAPTFEICGSLLASATLTSCDDKDWCDIITKQLSLALNSILTRRNSVTNFVDFVCCVELLANQLLHDNISQSEIVYEQKAQLIDNLSRLTSSAVSAGSDEDSQLNKVLNILMALADHGEVATDNKADMGKEWVTLCTQVMSLGLLHSIQYRSSEAILCLLKILRKTVHKLAPGFWFTDPDTKEIVTEYLNNCSSLSDHEDREVRAQFYQLTIDMAEQQLGSNSELTESSLSQIILRGILDPDSSISRALRNFASVPPRLPAASLHRATRIPSILFLPLLEDGASPNLALATNLLLESSSHSPDFLRFLFDRDLDPNLSGARQPLSACTINSQTTRSLQPGFIPASSDVTAFKAPQLPVTRRKINTRVPGEGSVSVDWLKLASSRLCTQRVNPSGTSLNEGEKTFDLSKWPASQIPGTQIVDEKVSSDTSYLAVNKITIQSSSSTYLHSNIEFRYLKASTQTTEVQTQQSADFHRTRHIQDRHERDKSRVTGQNLQKSAVYLFGNYRRGRLPDLKIQHCSVIGPIQMLAQANEKFSGILFWKLYSGLLREGGALLKPTQYTQCISELAACLDQIFENPGLCASRHATLVQSCLRIAIQDGLGPSPAPAGLLISKVSVRGIVRAAKITGNEILAVVLLEALFNRRCEEQRAQRTSKPQGISPRKKVCVEDDHTPTETGTLVSLLMRLYQGLECTEETVGLADVCCRQQATEGARSRPALARFRRATTCQVAGDLTAAFKGYNEIVTAASDLAGSKLETEVVALSQQSLVTCMERLCKWEELSQFLDKQTSHSNYINQKLLHRSIYSSKLRMVVNGVEDSPKVIKVLDNLEDTLKQSYPDFELSMSMELALLRIMKGQYHQAIKYCDIAEDYFLSNGIPLTHSASLDYLKTAQVIQEMREFLTVTNNTGPAVQLCHGILSKWSYRKLEFYRDPVDVWEDIFFHRNCYLKILKQYFNSQTELVKELDKYTLLWQLQFVDACIIQRRTLPALNALKDCRQLCFSSSHDDGDSYQMQWMLRYTESWLATSIFGFYGNQDRNISLDIDVVKGISNSLGHLQKLNSSSVTRETDLHVNSCYGRGFWMLGSAFCKQISIKNNSEYLEPLKKSVKKFISSVQDNPVSITTELFSKSFNHFKQCYTISASYDATDISGSIRNQTIKSLTNLSNFCDFVFEINNTEIKFLESERDIIKSYVESTLFCMKHGDLSARYKFPRVLQLTQKQLELGNKVLVEEFMKICDETPAWMFIPWLEQLITDALSVNSNLSKTVQSILERVTEEYPHAVFYPFQLACRDRTEVPPFANELSSKLRPLSLMHHFYSSMHHLSQPEEFLSSWLDYANEELNNPSVNLESSRSSIVSRYQSLYHNIFDESQISSQGVIFQEFSNRFRRDLIRFFQIDGSGLLHISQTEFAGIRQKLIGALQEWRGKQSGVGKAAALNSLPRNEVRLGQYSPWLAQFNLRLVSSTTSVASISSSSTQQNANNYTTQNWLEVPGQYSNIITKPNPRKHVRIFKFQQDVKIIFSKQCPKLLTILGDNDHQYRFLIKSGEDVRQDARIQQLFRVMNNFLSSSSSNRSPCSVYGGESNLADPNLLSTFNVIPFSTQLGAIEWVENTITLRHFLKRSMSPQEAETYEKLQNQYFSNNFTDSKSYLLSWLKTCHKSSSKQQERKRPIEDDPLTNQFRSSQLQIAQMDLLRRGLSAASQTPELYYTARLRFIRQFAIVSVASYLLGIGDRHLGNFLVVENGLGQLVPIDFGYAFGVTSIVLPIPELVPFRLTSSPVALFSPAGVSGLFSQQMQRSLHHLTQGPQAVSSRTALSALLSVFLSSQILDWKRLSRATQLPLEQFTQSRLQIVHKKLSGEQYCPYRLLIEEIKLRHGNQDPLPDWLIKLNRFSESCCLCGDKSSIDNERNQYTLTDELIHMATNSTYLARMFRGWEPLL